MTAHGFLYTAIYLWTALYASTSGRLGIERLTERVGLTSYTLYSNRYKYSQQQAAAACTYRGAVVAIAPIPSTMVAILAENVEGLELGVWVTDRRGQCRTLQKICKTLRNFATGGSICTEHHWIVVPTDCSKERFYVLCQIGERTRAPTTTTRPTTKTTPTTVPVTTPTTPPKVIVTRASATGSTPNKIIYIASRRPNPSTEDGNGSRPKEPGPSMGDGGGLKEMAKKAIIFLLVIVATTDKSLLGLIVAVVTGAFLIFALFICICCACRNRSKVKQRKKYELIHGFSSITMDRGHRTDTTEDTSIEGGSSDDRSYSVRHDDFYDGIVFPTILPPPPLLQEQTTTASVCDIRPPTSLQNSIQSRRYNTMGGRMPIQNAVDNNVYASINKHRKQEMSHNTQDLPLPPPPPIDTGVTDDAGTLSRGLSQCSIAGCRSDTGTLTSNQSRQSRRSRQSRNSKKSRRDQYPPHPTTYSPAGGRPPKAWRNGGHRESLELVSTNL